MSLPAAVWNYITRSLPSIFPPLAAPIFSTLAPSPLIFSRSLPPLGGRVGVGGHQDMNRAHKMNMRYFFTLRQNQCLMLLPDLLVMGQHVRVPHGTFD